MKKKNRYSKNNNRETVDRNITEQEEYPIRPVTIEDLLAYDEQVRMEKGESDELQDQSLEALDDDYTTEATSWDDPCDLKINNRESLSSAEVAIKDKFCLTINEACKYFGIGSKKLRRLVRSRGARQFVINNGVKILIKRHKFEEFLEGISEI
jgi:excisionase family DNA binding protein